MLSEQSRVKPVGPGAIRARPRTPKAVGKGRWGWASPPSLLLLEVRPQAPSTLAASPGTCRLSEVEVHSDLWGGVPVLTLELRLHGGWFGAPAPISSVSLGTIFMASI